MKKSILLVNPWIYDFAAYDFWSKPLGLLQVGGALKQSGFDVQLFDCLDRMHPTMESGPVKQPKSKADGTGKYIREVISKPEVVNYVPRHFARYGMPYDLVKEQLLSLPGPPDLIVLTSIMTYWYPAVKDMRDLLKTIFPDTPLMLGGIYATLCPEHAWSVIRPDYLITGPDTHALLEQVASVLGVDLPVRDHDHAYPRPAYDLYPRLDTIALMTSRGCPNRCSFCASHALFSGYHRYAPDVVNAEIRYWHDIKQFNHLAFYDDALLHRPEQYIIPLLEMLVDNPLPIRLHTPNGLQPRYVDRRFSDLFKQAGGHTVRLSFETVNPDRQKTMSSKVSNHDLMNAVINLKNAGIPGNQIGVYILMGLPDQGMQEVIDSIKFVTDLGVKVNLASFSPIPGTKDWDALVDRGLWSTDHDLLLTNTTIYPLWARTYGFDKVEEFVQEIKQRWLHYNNISTILPLQKNKDH